MPVLGCSLDHLTEEPVAEDIERRQAGAVGRPQAKSGRVWGKVCQWSGLPPVADLTSVWAFQTNRNGVNSDLAHDRYFREFAPRLQQLVQILLVEVAVH